MVVVVGAVATAADMIAERSVEQSLADRLDVVVVRFCSKRCLQVIGPAGAG